LTERAARARLAKAGDHIDYVVTLLSARGETVGRLERQTKSGTVAIRELRDASCERVADGIALSLGLALDPGAALPAPVSAPEPATPPTPDAAPPKAEAPPIAVAEPAPIAAETAVAPDTRTGSLDATTSASSTVGDDRTRTASPPERRHRSIGLQGGALLGVTPGALARAELFLDIDRVLALVPDLSLRVALAGALGSTTTAIGPVQHWIAAGRGEVCPWRLGGMRVNVRPCLGVELGATGASGERQTGLHDTGLWAAPTAGLRGAFALVPSLAVEAEAGGMVPLIRHEILAGQQTLYQAETVVFYAALGVSIVP
jgi:hypothetical protein